MIAMSRRAALAAGLACMTGGARAAQGFDPRRLAAIRPALEQTVSSGVLPGVVAVAWRRGGPAQVYAVGRRDIARDLPMRRETIFRIASMSKPVTVAAAMTLVEDGRMRLDDPITRWAPEFANMRVLRRADGPLDDTDPAPRAITVEDLMTHRAGFAYSFLSTGPLAQALSARLGMGIESAMDPDAWMRSLAELPLAYAPGERFNYGHGIDVLGFIAGRAAGSDLRTLLRERLFGPLRMRDTDFWIPPAKRDRAAAVYSSPGPNVFNPVEIAGFVGPKPPVYTSGGQGLASTADDYLTFARMLVGGGRVNGARVLRPESVALMTSNRLAPPQRAFHGFNAAMLNGRSQGFGLGMYVVMDGEGYTATGAGAAATGAYGWPGAFGGYWQADPARELVWIWLQEVLPASPAPGRIPRLPGVGAMRQFQNQVYAALA